MRRKLTHRLKLSLQKLSLRLKLRAAWQARLGRAATLLPRRRGGVAGAGGEQGVHSWGAFLSNVANPLKSCQFSKVALSKVEMPLKLTDVDRGYLGAVMMNYAGRLKREVDLVALSWRSQLRLKSIISAIQDQIAAI